MEFVITLSSEWRDAYGVLPIVLAGGSIIGLIFGIFAERSDFCSRMALVNLMDGTWRKNASSLITVLLAMLTALIAVQSLVYFGFENLDMAVSHETDLRVGGIIIGSCLFGIGMVMARGCVSRLLVLTARGNSRALITSVFLALVAWSSISGILAQPRLALAGFLSVPFDANHSTTIAAILGLMMVLGIILLWSKRGNFTLSQAVAPIVIGLLVGGGFVVTGIIGADDFDPVAVEGLRFLQPVTETLSWWVYASALPLKFGLALVIATIIGAGLSAKWGGRTKIEGFDDAPHPLRYISGAVLMGFGGVVSGGCTIGWMLNNAATAHIGVILAIVGYMIGYQIFQGGVLTSRRLKLSHSH